LRGEKLEFETKTFAPTDGADVQDVEVGLNLRDQNIGYIRLQTENDWNQEDQSWVESLATQVAISLENARLIEESQESALRERLSASIVQKIWASNSIDNILQTAIRELGRALEASEATIELKIDEN
jgi:GAF domain-containing protein